MNKYEIVKRLEYCAENKCDICQEENGSGFPWIDGRCYGFTERLYDALTLLKAQNDQIIMLERGLMELKAQEAVKPETIMYTGAGTYVDWVDVRGNQLRYE